MHCVLTCNCIELLGMKVYSCIYVSFNHGINDAVQVLQMYKIVSACLTAVSASAVERTHCHLPCRVCSMTEERLQRHPCLWRCLWRTAVAVLLFIVCQQMTCTSLVWVRVCGLQVFCGAMVLILTALTFSFVQCSTQTTPLHSLCAIIFL